MDIHCNAENRARHWMMMDLIDVVDSSSMIPYLLYGDFLPEYLPALWLSALAGVVNPL